MTALLAQTQPPRRAYSISEFCATFGVSRSKTYLLLAAGELTAVKLGSKNLIRSEEAERWFNSLTRGRGHEHLALEARQRSGARETSFNEREGT